jgi:hypothetical protein
MSPAKTAISNVFAILGIGVVSFLLFLMLIPNIEASRTEARLMSAYNRVREISNAYRETPSLDLFTTHDIPETDPWGQPYLLVEVDKEKIRALSSGPNMVTPEVGVDHDDVYSDMPVPPMAPIRAEKKKQLLIATGVSTGLWFLFSAIYLRTRN